MKIKKTKDIIERVRFIDLETGDLFRCTDDDDSIYMAMEGIESVGTSVYNCVCLNDGSTYDLNVLLEVIPITDYEFIVKE